MKSPLALVLAAAALAGCASRLPDNEALIAPKTVFVVPRPEAASGTTTVAQSIVARYRDHTFAFDAQIQIAPDTFDLVALDGLGRRALTVHWQAGKVDFQAAPWLPPMVRPADILADIAIVYGPQLAVSQSAAQFGAILKETGSTRAISRDSRDLVVVHYGNGQGWDRDARLHNLAFGYEIDIRSKEVAP